MDCNDYLPIPSDEPTEFGICLRDEAFEPYIEALMEGEVPGSCQALLEIKKFVGDRPACPDFDEAEIIEVDDDSPLGLELRRLSDGGEPEPEALLNAAFENLFRSIDWKASPVDLYEKQLKSHRSSERNEAISRLSALIALGNPAAFRVLLRFLSSLPAPATIEAVHLKMEILRHLEFWRDKSDVAPTLIKELDLIPSNNTTRQWISAILKFLEHCPLQLIEDPLRRMLAERKFSARRRKTVTMLLSRSSGS